MCQRWATLGSNTVAEAADPVERVVLMATVAQRVLLDPAADLVNHLGAEPNHC